jgi:hypothetical protein
MGFCERGNTMNLRVTQRQGIFLITLEILAFEEGLCGINYLISRIAFFRYSNFSPYQYY